jgi:alkylation response protein AidB-like acyl-CoA dehydrogenase
MHILVAPHLEQFRLECRDWLAGHVPRDRRPPEGVAMREFDLAWQGAQFKGGWAGLAWPSEFGGRGATLLEQLIWHEEYARAGGPPAGSMFVALSHAGPTLITAGSAAQKAAHLPRILRGEAVWCQGFSEPSAGSDLASLRCRAVVDGDHLVVNGTKIWTTYGHLADFQELLVRTDPTAARHKGISWVICDMKSPGIEIRPIQAMSGLTHFAQVFYDNVRIPLENLVGELHGGWRVAMTTLGFERGTGMMAHQLELAATVDRLIAIARSTPARKEGRKLIDDEATAENLAQLRAEVAALRSLTIASISRGLREQVPGPEANIGALYFGELSRRVYQAALDLLGPVGLEHSPTEDWPLHYFEAFKWAIGGGTSEIRRNAIGERVLGLPKGPR